jgi:cytidylate kinase
MNTDQSTVVISIDGPSGSGKGTLSQMLARRLGYHLLDSGALYRLVALAAIKRELDLAVEELIIPVAANLDVQFVVADSSLTILLDGENVTNAIRQEIVGMNASRVAAYPGVRSGLLDRQRAFAMPPGLVADGRDMGTVVFPDAIVKIFLTASAEARAERRFKQLQEKGEPVNKGALIADIIERDARDSNRSVSPLRPADDAVVIDSTDLGIEQVFNKMLEVIKAKLM